MNGARHLDWLLHLQHQRVFLADGGSCAGPPNARMAESSAVGHLQGNAGQTEVSHQGRGGDQHEATG